MLHNLQIHRQILQDLAESALRNHCGTFESLAYVAGLKDADNGRYVHSRLNTVYGEVPVDEACAACHLEIFEKLLEMPLAMQELDLRKFLESRSGGLQEELNRLGMGEGLIPAEAPDYLRELFLSNWRVLRELLQGPSTAH